MKPLTVYECPHCKKLFRTPNRHDCKFDPSKRNCFTCKYRDPSKDIAVTDDPGNEGAYLGCTHKLYCDNYGMNLGEVKCNNYRFNCSEWEERK